MIFAAGRRLGAGLGIADQARVINSFAVETDVGSGRFAVPIWNGNMLSVARPDDLAACLRRVVLVGQPVLTVFNFVARD